MHAIANAIAPKLSRPILVLAMRLIALILSIFILPTFNLSTLPPVPSHLNVSVIAAANDKSTLECWQLSAPFVQSSQAGTSGAAVTQLGDVSTTSYTLIPPEFDGGLHNAPVVQYVTFLQSFPCFPPGCVPPTTHLCSHTLSKASSK